MFFEFWSMRVVYVTVQVRTWLRKAGGVNFLIVTTPAFLLCPYKIFFSVEGGTPERTAASFTVISFCLIRSFNRYMTAVFISTKSTTFFSSILYKPSLKGRPYIVFLIYVWYFLTVFLFLEKSAKNLSLSDAEKPHENTSGPAQGFSLIILFSIFFIFQCAGPEPPFFFPTVASHRFAFFILLFFSFFPDKIIIVTSMK